MKCIDIARLLDYQNKILDESTSQKIREHLQTCSECQNLEKKLQGLKEQFQRFSFLKEASENLGCYDDLEILSIVEGKSKAREERQFYSHLSDCPACLDQLISLENFVDDLTTEGILPSKTGIKFKLKHILDKLRNGLENRIRPFGSIFQTPRPAFHFAGLLAILIIVIILLFDGNKMIPNSFKTREVKTNQLPLTLQLLEPSNHGVFETEGLQFRWNQIPNAGSYNFLLLNEQGNIIWEEKTPNTYLTLPQEIQLQPSGKYFWQVECFFDQGGSIISELANFSIIDR